MKFFRTKICFAVLFAASYGWLKAETVSIVIASNAAPRVQFGAEKMVAALKSVKLDATITHSENDSDRKIYLVALPVSLLPPESFTISGAMRPQDLQIVAGGDSGVFYGCLELVKRIRGAGKLPKKINFHDAPAMKLRGTCVAMQKTFILPGRKVYEYPITPELFPWFYDKNLWTDYLDFLAKNRMNTLYLWSGHPFASLVRLKDYPYAVEVSDDVFTRNQEMYRWLAQECDKRGIWLVQMFYNILVSKPFAETNHISTQLSAPTPLVADYTRKSIAEFVKQFPNVGLLVCLGEALQGTSNQVEWATRTILPGVLDGMKAAGLKEQPPVVIRTHAMNPEAIMPACFQVYSNLFTMTKYNGESLTTYEPRGKVQQTHLNMAKLGPHIVNVHILSNLEPFRYGATEFIRKSVLASRDHYGASGIHLYPLAYWNWPYSPDVVESQRNSEQEHMGETSSVPLLQWNRDWIWFEAWARYAWNPDVPAAEDRAYWVGRLGDFYGCDTNAAGKILDGYNEAGEVAPMLLRRFGITDGNRQTLSLGMTLDQLVNPQRYGAVKDLWESMAPPGERLDEYVRKELNHEPHMGETPESVIQAACVFSTQAQSNLAAAEPAVTRNREEFGRLFNDSVCLADLAVFYALKVQAAEAVLLHQGTTNALDMTDAENKLSQSVEMFKRLVRRTEDTYRFANSMQTGHRKIPFGGAANGVGTNYLWSQVLPLYEQELADFQRQVAELKKPKSAVPEAGAPSAAWPAAEFTLISTNAETYEVKVGARPFADRKYTITELAPELNGLTGIRFSHEEAKNGRYQPVEFEVTEPVRVLIGYFQSDRDLWLQVPNTDFAAQADERGGVDVVLRNAALIDECPSLNVHAFRYEPGRYKLEVIGKGSFVILGVVPQSVKLEKRDAGKE